MKKIGIITIHNSPNYGACLQAYALYKYIGGRGVEVEIIDLYRPYAYDDYVFSKKYTRERKEKLSILQRIKRCLNSIRHGRLKQKDYYNDVAYDKFMMFNSEIKLSRPYKSIDDLYLCPPDYDLYISGSDQLWNPEQPYCIEPYFLTFVPDNKQKISYATSIGITNLTDSEKSKFTKWLSTYTDISVREQHACNLLKNLTGRNVMRVADPTFLLDKEVWQSMISRKMSEPYILLFILTYNQSLVDYAKRLSRESGMQLVVLNQRQPDSDGSYFAEKKAGPKDFLSYIAGANLMITDSFHGTDFAILLGTNNFYSYIAPTSQRGSRIKDLLELCNLNNHLLDVDLSQSYETLSKNVIDREMVCQLVEEERKKSRNFLNKYL